MKQSPLRDKSFAFAIDIVKLAQFLQSQRKEFVLSKQILRSGTSIGALLREGEFASSTADFIYKFTISLKEANETEYWLLLLKETEYLSPTHFEDLHIRCKELIAMLISSIKTLKSSVNKGNPKA